jgi:hypothetical protein
MSSILGHLYKIAITFCAYLLITQTSIYVKAANNSSRIDGMRYTGGTGVIIYRTSSYIIIAADSSGTDNDGHKVKEHCKTIRLGDYAFFVAIGRTSFVDSSTGQKIADAHDAAIAAYVDSAKLYDIAETWASRVEPKNYKVGVLNNQALLGDLKTNYLVKGIFGGTDKTTGRLALSIAEVIHLTPTPPETVFSLRHSIDDRQITETGKWVFDGMTELQDVAREFFSNETVRAKEAKILIQQEIINRNLSEADAWALRAQKILELGIVWANNPAMGGPVSVLIAERGKSSRWFHRGVCD